jgi:hypothetical protein
VLHGDKYLQEGDVSVDVTVSESGTLYVLQADRECSKKSSSE